MLQPLSERVCRHVSADRPRTAASGTRLPTQRLRSRHCRFGNLLEARKEQVNILY